MAMTSLVTAALAFALWHRRHAGPPAAALCAMSVLATAHDGQDVLPPLDPDAAQNGQLVHVSGFPWFEPPAALTASLCEYCAEVSTAASDLRPVAIRFRPVSDSPSKRDQGKLHLGSAKVEFKDPDAAAAAVLALNGHRFGPPFPGPVSARVHVDPRSRAPQKRPPSPRAPARRASRRRKQQRQREAMRRVLVRITPTGHACAAPDGGAGVTRAEDTVAEDAGDVAAVDELGQGRARAAAAPPDGAPDADFQGMMARCYSALAGHAAADMGWQRMPVALHPGKGGLLGDDLRAQRKLWQVEYFTRVLARLRLPDGAVVVDFGSGSGNLVLPLAHRFPALRFVAVDLKARALELLEERAHAAGLPNVEAWVGSIEAYPASYDCALALHVCGAGTDLVISSAVQRGAVYVVAPCCIGKVRFTMDYNLLGKSEGGSESTAPSPESEDEPTDSDAESRTRAASARSAPGGTLALDERSHARWRRNRRGRRIRIDEQVATAGVVAYPRSGWLRAQLEDVDEEFRILAAAADYSGGPGDGRPGAEAGAGVAAASGAVPTAEGEEGETEAGGAWGAGPEEPWRRWAKAVVELDRQQWAVEAAGYHTWLLQFAQHVGRKRDVLVGAPPGHPSLEGLSNAVVAPGERRREEAQTGR